MSPSLLPDPPPLRPLLDPIVLRRVPAGPAPFAGDVVVHEGEPVLAVSAAEVEKTGIWAAGGEHVMAPLDLVSSAAGPLVLLPTTRCTLEALLRRRGSVEPGEAVTIAVSLLRGVASEISTHPRGECVGTWWLDTAGTPLFVHGHEGPTAAEGASEVLASLDVGDHDGAARAIAAASVAARDTARLVTGLSAAEDELFAAAMPQALRFDDSPVPAMTRAQARAEADEPAPAWRRLTVAMDGSLSDLVAVRVDALRRRWRRRAAEGGKPRSRRPVLLVGAGVVALVLCVGLLWPDSEQPTPQPVSAPVATASADVPDASPEPPAESAAPAQPTDPVAAARTLLAAWSACGTDDACRQELQEARIDADPAGAASVADVVLTVIDDLGGLTLLRAEDPSGRMGPQIVAIVRQQDEWVLRGIHDVAQHP